MSVIQDKNSRIILAKQQFIISATQQLIIQIGIDNITMDTIASASDYTKRTLYAYFKSKDEILLWVYTDDLIDRWTYQKEQLALGKTGLEKLSLWAVSLYEYCCDKDHTLQIQKYMDYHFVDLNKIGEPVFERFEKINNELAQGLRNILMLGKEDGSIRKEIENDITISQFLYSYRAILNRAFSEQYSFAQFNQREYVYHFLIFFIKSLSA